MILKEARELADRIKKEKPGWYVSYDLNGDVDAGWGVLVSFAIPFLITGEKHWEATKRFLQGGKIKNGSSR